MNRKAGFGDNIVKHMYYCPMNMKAYTNKDGVSARNVYFACKENCEEYIKTHYYGEIREELLTQLADTVDTIGNPFAPFG